MNGFPFLEKGPFVLVFFSWRVGKLHVEGMYGWFGLVCGGFFFEVCSLVFFLCLVRGNGGKKGGTYIPTAPILSKYFFWDTIY